MKTADKLIRFTCPVCGETKMVGIIPGVRKACSYTCSGVLRRKRVDRSCKECGIVFRPPNAASVYCSNKCRHSANGKRMIEKGLTPQKFIDEKKWRESVTSKEFREKIGAIKKGVIQTKPLVARNSARHHRAVTFFVKSPENVTYLVMSIVKFVREHEHLFLPEQIKWKNDKGSWRCRATIGFHQIYRGYAGVWRGWMVVSQREGRENIDLLPRQFKDVGGVHQ